MHQHCSSNNQRRSKLLSRLSTITLVIATLLVFVAMLCGQSNQFGFQPRMITRFCYNSPNLSTINSQCVLCNYYTFDSTLLGCTGSTALSVNISASQAFCVISQCLGQVRQSPVFLGRRRKRESTDDDDKDEDDNNDKRLRYGNASNRFFSIIKQVDADVYYEDV